MYTLTGAPAHVVVPGTLKGTSPCSKVCSNTVSYMYKTYKASQEESGCVETVLVGQVHDTSKLRVLVKQNYIHLLH